jgi:MYXO-CTERM domain-containing protein
MRGHLIAEFFDARARTQVIPLAFEPRTIAGLRCLPSIAAGEVPTRPSGACHLGMTLRNLLLLCPVSLVGCTGGDPLSRDKDVAGWANASSALGVFAIGYEPLGFADGAYQFEDPACPVTSDDGTTVTIRGDCTDNKGTTWSGTATLVRDGTARGITFDGYGNDAILGMQRTSGRFDVSEADGAHAFDVDVQSTGGIKTAISYTGTVTGGYQGRTVWNGSGSISRDGITINSGSVDAVTADEVRDDAVCAGQGASGTTKLTSNEHEVVIAYDGATDCDPDAAAHWTRDGQDMGTIKGISCSTANGTGFGAIAFALAFVLRRRHEASRSR